MSEDIKIGDYVRHSNGHTGRVAYIEGIYARIEYSSHRYKLRFLTLIGNSRVKLAAEGVSLKADSGGVNP